MSPKTRENKSMIEPQTDISDNGRYICISTSLPGVNEEKIRLDLENNKLTISATGDEKTYKKVIRVPDYTKFYRKKFNGGILEIVMEKPAP